METIFYESIAVGAIFKGADLTDANFTDADLRDANFKGATLKRASFGGAKLSGANFTGSHGLSPVIADQLDDEGVFRVGAGDAADADSLPAKVKVFVSAAGVATPVHRTLVELIGTTLRDDGFEVARVSRDQYHPEKHLTEVKAAVAACAGMVVIGLPQLRVSSGSGVRALTTSRRFPTKSFIHPGTTSRQVSPSDWASRF